MVEEKLEVIFDSLDKFYAECDILESTGNADQYREHANKDDPRWVGLPLKNILESKYSYTKGLDNLAKLDEDLALGSSKTVYNYADDDGDDMNYDRFIEGLPSLKKRVRKSGNLIGRFVNIHVNICECAGVNYEKMLYKAYTAIKIIDYLEKEGFRTQVSVCTEVEGLGYLKDAYLQYLCTEVVIKKIDEPTILPTILTCISPWMFRHHFFKFWTAKFNTRYGLGRPSFERKASTKEDIYISSGECLDEQSMKNKIKEINKLFEIEE